MSLDTIHDDAIELAKELTLIATNPAYEDLRGDMVTRVVQQRLIPRSFETHTLALLTIQRLCDALEVLSDELAREVLGGE